MGVNKKLSIIVLTDATKHSYKKDIDETLKSLAGFMGVYDKAECLLAYSDEDERTILEKTAKKSDIPVSLLKHSDADTVESGEYIFILRQGDVLDSALMLREILYMERTDRGVYAFKVRKKGTETEDDADSENQWVSIFGGSSVTLYDPHGIAIKRSKVDRVSSLLSGDAKATGTVLGAVIKEEGFIRIASKNALKSEHAQTISYTIDDSVMDRIIDLSVKKFGRVEDYLQNVFIALFMLQKGEGSTDAIRRYLKYVDVENIANSKRLQTQEKLWLFNLKYGKEVLKEAEISDYGQISYEGNYISDLSKLRFRIDVTELNKGILQFEGRTELHLLNDTFKVEVISSEGEVIFVEMTEFPALDVFGPEGETICPGERFKVVIPVKDGVSYRIYLKEDTGRMFHITPVFSKYSRFAYGDVRKAVTINGYTITYDNATFTLSKSSGCEGRRNERRYLAYLIRKKKYRVAAYRVLYHLDKFFFKKPVWIVADRPHIANDNGEHMFRYLQKTESATENTIYFLIRKDSPDYERLKKTGKVLNYGSYKHKIKFLRSNVIMCAAANDLAINSMGGSGKYYRDLIDYHFVYLRHGVSHNDQSRWINKLGKHISLLVATCRPEYEGILEGSYDYTEKEVRLTGLPRYDNLYDEREKEIIILPTWRKNLEGEAEYRSSERGYSTDFADSDYCKFYNGLINNERLLAVMKEYGYKGSFYLHPVFERQFKDFRSSELITVGKGVADYQELFRKGAIMVTDFSSVAFDFAFLKKPVIYAQFDEDVFYKYHSWGKGYFTYRKDGFGPITNTLDETVDELIYYIKNDCKMKEEYIKKVDNFFAYTDRNNCKRVYDAVVELEKERGL